MEQSEKTEEYRKASGADKIAESLSNNEEAEFDYDSIWSNVFKEGEAAKGSFYIIGSSARLVKIENHSFTVAVRGEHVKKHAENNRQLLEKLMAKHTGAQRSMRIIMEGEDVCEHDKSIEDIAVNASEVLGIDIEIQ